MVTRFSANEARLKAVSAKNSLNKQRKEDEEVRKSQSKERAFINQSFESQRASIISAAIDGKTELEVNRVFLYKELVALGIQVVEQGQVTKQLVLKGKAAASDKRERIKDEIFELFNSFIDKSKVDLKGYYGSFKRFHGLHYEALNEVINSTSSWSQSFYGDNIYCEEVPENLTLKYFDDMERINKKIKEYKEGTDEIESLFDFPDIGENGFDDEPLINGEYFYTDNDDEADVLEPTIEGNKIKIRWSSDGDSTYMNDPLFSDAGLAWLSNHAGQSLIEAVFEALISAADKGKSTQKLEFALTTDGWSFVTGYRNIWCCMPDDLVDIITAGNFNIVDTKSTQKYYSIKVSW